MRRTTPRFPPRWLIFTSLLVVAYFLSFVSCTSSDTEDGRTKTIDDTPRLPTLHIDDADCEKSGVELTLQDWVHKGDALVVGEIIEIAPALDIGWPIVRDTEQDPSERVYSKNECEEIQDALRIRMRIIAGYFQDIDLLDTVDIYFGASDGHLLANPLAPMVSESGVTWPQGQTPSLALGMTVGGLIYYNPMVKRWSFGPGQRMPIFEVLGGKIRFQSLDRPLVKRCGEWPPIRELDGMSVDDLRTEIRKLDSQNKLNTPVSERDWSIQRDLDRQVSGVASFVGSCVTKTYLEKREQAEHADCSQDRDCDAGTHCQSGTCK